MEPHTNTQRYVALFGGSFNPPHLGHSAICRWLLAEMGVDEIWVIPCFIHPLEKPLAPFEHRLMMCKLAFLKLLLPIRVLDIEKKLGGPSYTLRTIEYVRGERPDLRYGLVVGSDIEREEPQWREFDRIRELADLIRVPRGPQSPIPDVSSTHVRDLMRGKKPYRDLVEKEVAIYIATKGLYRSMDEEPTLSED